MQATQRGITTYKILLFDDNIVTVDAPNENRGGRNPLLIEKRDEFLFHRIYFKTTVQRKLYEDVLDELESEVYLSKTMLKKIINSRTDELLQIKRNKPTIKELKDKFPHIVWQ